MYKVIPSGKCPDAFLHKRNSSQREKLMLEVSKREFHSRMSFILLITKTGYEGKLRKVLPHTHGWQAWVCLWTRDIGRNHETRWLVTLAGYEDEATRRSESRRDFGRLRSPYSGWFPQMCNSLCVYLNMHRDFPRIRDSLNKCMQTLGSAPSKASGIVLEGRSAR